MFGWCGISLSMKSSDIVECSSNGLGSLAIIGGIRVTIIHASRIPSVMYASRSSPACDLARSKCSTTENWGKIVQQYNQTTDTNIQLNFANSLHNCNSHQPPSFTSKKGILAYMYMVTCISIFSVSCYKQRLPLCTLDKPGYMAHTSEISSLTSFYLFF